MNTLIAGPLALEPLQQAHAAEMFAVLQDSAIYEFENEPPESAAVLGARYAKLESRASPDGSEQWLNWAVRRQQQELIGFVQATVLPGNKAYVAYVLHSHYWRRGLGSAAVTAMLAELRFTYSVLQAYAVLKEANFRSVGLLAKLGFTPLGSNVIAPWEQEQDEVTMTKPLVTSRMRPNPSLNRRPTTAGTVSLACGPRGIFTVQAYSAYLRGRR